ncbi:MAG: type II secretory pathway pseudopilin PulG [Alteromonadaceae bacterium]|jgi:type II secretory pathway pseudopilin PulG
MTINIKTSTYKSNEIKHSKGFTLLEVLVASTILFASIAIVTLIFKTAYVASEKAQRKLVLTSVIPTLLPIIQQEIRSQTTIQSEELTGNGTQWGITYQWKGRVTAFESPADKLDSQTAQMDSYPKRYKKWQVELIVGTEKNQLNYQYNELSWLTN